MRRHLEASGGISRAEARIGANGVAQCFRRTISPSRVLSFARSSRNSLLISRICSSKYGATATWSRPTPERDEEWTKPAYVPTPSTSPPEYTPSPEKEPMFSPSPDEFHPADHPDEQREMPEGPNIPPHGPEPIPAGKPSPIREPPLETEGDEPEDKADPPK